MYKSLSIIIPCFKLSKNKAYLSELLIRISNQKISSFNLIEVIIVNDSPDELFDINFFKSFELPIKYYVNPQNYGQAYSRNFGFHVSRGAYIHFIDQDDLISDDFYKQFDGINVEVGIASCYLFNQFNSKPYFRSLKTKIYKRFSKLYYLRFFLIFENISLSPGQILLKREVVEEVNGFPVLNFFGSDDYGFLYNLSESFSIRYLFKNEAVFLHRIHEFQGKNTLKMSSSKKEFLISKNTNDLFLRMCIADSILAKSLKTFLYLIFCNRLN